MVNIQTKKEILKELEKLNLNKPKKLFLVLEESVPLRTIENWFSSRGKFPVWLNIFLKLYKQIKDLRGEVGSL